MPDFTHEISAGAAAGQRVAGVDEVGRGPLAGPVIAAAVILSPALAEKLGTAGLDDSKRLTARRRANLLAVLVEAKAGGQATIGLGSASVADIARLNILHAAMLAMRRAVDALGAPPGFALVDGNRLPDLPCAGKALVGGDRASLSIAAASVVAKVVRDRLMAALARRHPAYGWERNAGYGTRQHLEALGRHGATAHHRAGFGPVAQLGLPMAGAG